MFLSLDKSFVGLHPLTWDCNLDSRRYKSDNLNVSFVFAIICGESNCSKEPISVRKRRTGKRVAENGRIKELELMNEKMKSGIIINDVSSRDHIYFQLFFKNETI